jgi:nickel-dependent lactate racemase
MKWFDEPSSKALERRLREAYEVNGQTAWSLLTKSERYRVVLVSDLPDDQVRLMQMIPAHSLTSALNESAVESQGYIMPHGARFLPRVTS